MTVNHLNYSHIKDLRHIFRNIKAIHTTDVVYNIILVLGDFNDDDEMVKKPLSLNDPTDNSEKEFSNSRTGTLRSPAKFGSFFRNFNK